MNINKILIKKVKVGKFTSELYWYKIDNIWIDNTYHVIVKDEKNNIINEIDTLKNSVIYKHDISQIIYINNIKNMYISIPENSISNELILIDPEHKFWLFKEKIDKPFLGWVTHNKITGDWKVIDIITGIEVAIGIPVPNSKSLAVSGPSNGVDVWYEWRDNAEYWYKNFNTKCLSIGLATADDVISNVQNPDTKYYFNIAHGGSTSCQMYNGFLFGSHINNAMIDRNPMTFTFLAHCDAMIYTNEGTFSYEFRKGETSNTVVVGYIHMEKSPGWIDSLSWQHILFTGLYNNLNLKDAFDYACATYPSIIDAVKYDGDENLTIYPTSCIQPTCILSVI